MTKQHLAVKRSVVAVALTLASTSVVFAQQEAAAPVTKVYVTGSNIKRADKEGSSPVGVLNAKQIEATGANTVAELLHSIPAFGSGTSNDITDGSFSKGTSTASLRGLGSSSTLILLNGRRITASAYADPNQGKSAVYDLNSIPVSAIDRVEIFKDGASAVYGSDAIAGVINFITKTDYQGAEIKASTSANDDGEFARNNVNGVFGFGDLDKDRYNAFLSFDLAQRSRTGIKDVEDIKKGMYSDINARLNPYSSYVSDQAFFFRERTPGARNFATTLANASGIVNRLDCDPSQRVTGNRAANNLTATSLLNGRTFCNYDANENSEAQSKGKDANILGRLTVQITPDITSFTEVGYSRVDREYTGNPSTISSTAPTTVFRTDGLPSDYQVILPVGHADNPFADSRAALAYRFTDAPSGSKNVNTAYRFLTGLKGTTGQFDWESGFLVNRSEREESINGRLYRPTIERIASEGRTLAETAADPSAVRNLTNRGYAQVMQLDAKASTTVGQLAGGDIGLAFGGEIRQEKIALTPDELTQRGEIIGLANSLVDGRRMVKSAFVELRTPFTKNFEMDFAGRYDKYPTESNFVPKVGAKWEVNDKLTFRGTYAEGFRAPALTQVSPGGVQSFLNNFNDPIRCPDKQNPLPGADQLDCKKSISNMSTPNPQLKSETSKSYSFGAIINPTRNLDILIDYYKIRKENETALQGSTFVAEHQDQFPDLVIRDQNPANQLRDANGNVIPNSGPLQAINTMYVNQGATEVTGIDLEIAHRLSLGDMGRLTTKLDWNHAISFRRAEQPGDKETNLVGTIGGLSNWATSVGEVPRNRASVSTNWTKGVHSLTGSVDYVSGVSMMLRSDNYDVFETPMCYYGVDADGATQPGGLPKFSNWTSKCEVASWTTVNLAYSYTGFKNWTLSANIRNLFDRAAPYDPSYDTEGFNSQLHNGFGRYFRLTASYKF